MQDFLNTVLYKYGDYIEALVVIICVIIFALGMKNLYGLYRYSAQAEHQRRAINRDLLETSLQKKNTRVSSKKENRTKL